MNPVIGILVASEVLYAKGSHSREDEVFVSKAYAGGSSSILYGVEGDAHDVGTSFTLVRNFSLVYILADACMQAKQWSLSLLERSPSLDRFWPCRQAKSCSEPPSPWCEIVSRFLLYLLSPSEAGQSQ